MMFGFKEVYLYVVGLIVYKYYEIPRPSNRLYGEWTTQIGVDELKELLSSFRRSFVVFSRALFKAGNTEVVVLIFGDLDIVKSFT